MDITTLDRYQMEALRTRGNSDLVVMVLGLAGEAGEVADHVKKHLGQGHDLDRNRVIEELGDIMWYVAGLADSMDVSLAEVATRNINKLKARYPDGFSSERSINREDTLEHGV